MNNQKDSYSTGELAPIGQYICMYCKDQQNANFLLHDDKSKKLPECPACGKTKWYKI